MKKIICISTLVMVMLLACNVWAEKITDSSLDKLMSLSGINKQFSKNSVSDMVLMGIESAKKDVEGISDIEFADMKIGIGNAFSAEDLLKRIRDEIKKNVSESETKNLFIWYESDLGKKITKAEEKASTAEAFKEMCNNAETLLKEKKRVELAQKMDESLNISDTMVQLQIKTAAAVFIAISIAMEPDKKVNLKAFKENLKIRKPQMIKKTKEMSILSLVYSYRNISIDSLKKYIEFVENPKTKNFNDAAMSGIKKALNHSIKKMAKSLAKLFKKHSKIENKH